MTNYSGLLHNHYFKIGKSPTNYEKYSIYEQTVNCLQTRFQMLHIISADIVIHFLSNLLPK